MKMKRISAVAGVILATAAFAPVTFAQMGGAPAAGGAPVSGSMSGGHPGSLANYNPMKQIPPEKLKHEKDARKSEANLGRRLAAARAKGVNVSNAEAEKNAGSAALARGDRVKALQDFRQANQDLQTASNPPAGNATQ